MSEIIKQINVDGVDYNIVSESAEKKIAEIDEKIKGLEGNTSDELTKITYSELKALRDNGELLEGHLYRITDYVTTTVQRETKSANHPFDIIVTALSANTLDEKASAIAHEGDTYFDGNDLGAWELWYDMDNDTAKFEWADATNGKGVIYRMIDEKYNDCPYDFKNILFYNNEYTNLTAPDNYYFTFSYVVNGILYDGTVETQVPSCYSNEMGVYIRSEQKVLNGNVFRNILFGSTCHNNTFGSNCSHNTFGSNCHNNTFGSNCISNILGSSCHSNTLGLNCYSNTFDSGYYVYLGMDMRLRKIGSNKTSITLNEEYYDDGSGQVVPIKHPDLSTQPSILPYKFMGKYVYEQLIPKDAIADYGGHFINTDVIAANDMYILEAVAIGKTNTTYIDCNIDSEYGVAVPGFNHDKHDYLRIIYTSMPKESGYYGYNEY